MPAARRVPAGPPPTITTGVRSVVEMRSVTEPMYAFEH